MCRNITELRGLVPPATSAEVEAAARQYLRKVSGLSKPNPTVAVRFDEAVARIAALTAELLESLPERRQPPATVPPMRRPDVRRRMGLDPM